MLKSQIIETLVKLLTQRSHLEFVVHEHVFDSGQSMCQLAEFLVHRIKPCIHCAAWCVPCHLHAVSGSGPSPPPLGVRTPRALPAWLTSS